MRMFRRLAVAGPGHRRHLRALLILTTASHRWGWHHQGWGGEHPCSAPPARDLMAP
jgi:hypothetical protein